MKKLSRKWLILEHYIQTAEEVMDGATVRLWKPKTMDRLPAYDMRSIMCHYHDEYKRWYRHEKNVKVCTGNPDHGLFDAQTVIFHDPHRQCVDIYICALLMRPFSREAQDHYEKRMSLPAMDRLILMWDSRQFDREGNYPVSPTGGIAYSKGSTYEDLFKVVNSKEDIADSSVK